MMKLDENELKEVNGGTRINVIPTTTGATRQIHCTCGNLFTPDLSKGKTVNSVTYYPCPSCGTYIDINGNPEQGSLNNALRRRPR